jgi:hypothetical protein
MAELTPMQSRYLDKALDTQLALWSALLQVEGLLLAVASIFASLAPGPAPLAIVIVVSTLVCGTMLVWNFLSTRNTYLKIGQILTERRPQSESDISEAGQLFRRVRTREKATLVLLVIQVLLVIWASLRMAYR